MDWVHYGQSSIAMKPRLILYLALIVSGSVWIAIVTNARFPGWLFELKQQHNQPAVFRTNAEGRWTKKLKTPWKDTKVALYRPTGEVVELDAKKAVYTVWPIKTPPTQGKGFDFPVVAFIDPATQNIEIGWLGSGNVETNEFNGESGVHAFYLTDTNLFIETGSEIFNGDTEINDGTFSWTEGLIKKAQPGEGLDAVIDRLDKDDSGSFPFYPASWTTSFGDYFQEDFFSSGNLGSQTIPIQRIEVGNGKLRLDFASLKYGITGSVWLDLKTLQVRRAVEYVPVQFNVKTLCRGIAPSLAAILTMAWTLSLARRTRSLVCYIFSIIVLVIDAWALLGLYQIYIAGEWSPHVAAFHYVFPLGDQWPAFLPIIGIWAGLIIVALQASLLRIHKQL
jgi:hypothetical protein